MSQCNFSFYAKFLLLLFGISIFFGCNLKPKESANDTENLANGSSPQQSLAASEMIKAMFVIVIQLFFFLKYISSISRICVYDALS